MLPASTPLMKQHADIVKDEQYNNEFGLLPKLGK